MAYAEKRDGKLTGWFYGQVYKDGKKFVRRFDKKKDAEGYELYVGLTGTEPPTSEGALSGRTFATVAQECKARGGPEGKWLNGKDHSIIQRVDYVTAVVGHIDIVAFKRGDFQLIIDSLRKRPASASKAVRGPGKGSKVLTDATINRYLNAASAVLTFAMKEEYREGKPETPLLEETENLRDIVESYDQEDAILRTMEAHGNAVEATCVRVLVASGLRKGELLNQLQPSQITVETDAEQNEVGMIRLRGRQTKGKEFREVSIPAQLARDIRAIMAAGKLPSADRLLDTFKKARDACGFQGNLLIHSLRHTRNTRLRKAGVDIDLRMKLLGHKTVKTSQRYDHIDSSDLLEAAKKVERARGLSPQNGEVVPFRSKLTG